MTEPAVNMRTITLKELWELFLKKLAVIILAAGLIGGGMLAYHMITYTPEYSSTATLYILRREEAPTSGDASSDFSTALKVIADCSYLLKSHAVVEEVIRNLELELSYRQLYEAITVYNPENSRILEVTVQSDSPENAKRIVDALCAVGTSRIDAVMGYEQINLFEQGTLNSEPSNDLCIPQCILAGLAAGVFTYSVYLVRFLLDDRISENDDVEKNLGLNLLGDIPNADTPRKKAYAGKTTGKTGVKGRGGA